MFRFISIKELALYLFGSVLISLGMINKIQFNKSK